MTKEKALEWFDFAMKDMENCDLKEAMKMGRDALEAQEPEEDFCEACQIHYPEDEA